MGKITGKPYIWWSKNHGFRLRFSQTIQSSESIIFANHRWVLAVTLGILPCFCIISGHSTCIVPGSQGQTTRPPKSRKTVLRLFFGILPAGQIPMLQECVQNYEFSVALHVPLFLFEIMFNLHCRCLVCWVSPFNPHPPHLKCPVSGQFNLSIHVLLLSTTYHLAVRTS